MACLYGARLAPHAEVTLLGTWPEGLAALRAHGVRLREADGSEHEIAVAVSDDPAQCAGSTMALVLVKSWQTERAAGRCALFIGLLLLPKTNVVGPAERAGGPAYGHARQQPNNAEPTGP